MNFRIKNQHLAIWLKRLPTLFLLAIFLGGLIWYAPRFNYWPLSNWSWSQLLLLTTIFLFTAYFAISLFQAKLQNINNYLCYFGIFMLIGLEIIFQFMPQLIPGQLINYLPKKTVERIRIEVGYEWGYYTGENMIYHYPPSRQMDYGQLKRPFVHIDNEGFRNPNQDSSEYDIVLLGDSMLFALDAQRDLGDRFRQAGSSAINLGMEGYSPQQYRDVYQNYIIDRNIGHQHVLIFLYIGNDFSDATAYRSIVENGGDYTDYIIGDTYGDPRLPLTINLLRGLPHFLFPSSEEEYDDGDFPQTLSSEEEEDSADMIDGRIIDLPYTTVEVHDWLWPPPAISSTDNSWELVSNALDDIIFLAEEAGATPMFFLLPSPLTVYSEYELNPPPNNSLKKYDRNHATVHQLLVEYTTSQNVSFVDLDSPLKTEIGDTFIFAAKDDGHFSDEGLDVVFEIVYKELENR